MSSWKEAIALSSTRDESVLRTAGVTRYGLPYKEFPNDKRLELWDAGHVLEILTSLNGHSSDGPLISTF